MPESQIRRLITTYFERGELEPIVTLCESHYANMQRAEQVVGIYLEQIRVLNSHHVISPGRQAGVIEPKTREQHAQGVKEAKQILNDLETEITQNLEDLI